MKGSSSCITLEPLVESYSTCEFTETINLEKNRLCFKKKPQIF